MDTPPVATTKKLSRPLQILMVVGGLILVVAGVAQFSRGVTEIFGAGNSAETNKLVQEIGDAVDIANKTMIEAQPKFQKILDDVDSLGLAKVRQEQKAVTQAVMAQFATSKERFRFAAKRSAEGAQKDSREKFKSYLTFKAQTYGYLADACALNQDIARMVQDESINKLDDLIAKAQDAGKRRDDAQKNAADAEAKANAAIKDGKDNPK